MSKRAQDGGLAFPGSRHEPNDPAIIEQFGRKFVEVHYPGMSMRDWFAGQALSLLGGRSWDKSDIPEGGSLMTVWATAAYALADAMLTARDDPPPTTRMSHERG